MRTAGRALLVCGLTALLFGCAEKFTRERFDIIAVGVEDREDVIRTLGEPRYEAGDEMYFEDLDRNLHARVFFGPDGRVRGKEWMDARRGEWDGRHPDSDPPPQGEVRESRRRNTTVKP
ncbi:MAG: hypothetical protein HRU75_08040 [Planctomycetia bacterium]|nr:MAG: hypothetical protein HRU75_08040 [Planctomycetia bacterium]